MPRSPTGLLARGDTTVASTRLPAFNTVTKSTSSRHWPLDRVLLEDGGRPRIPLPRQGPRAVCLPGDLSERRETLRAIRGWYTTASITARLLPIGISIGPK